MSFRLSSGIRQGKHGFGSGCDGPHPPSGVHRYSFDLYALAEGVNLPPGAARRELQQTIRHRVLEEAQLMGRFGKG